MQSILDAITEWIKEILIGAINGNLSTMFGDVNEKVGTIAAEVGQTPQGWNAGIFSMIRSLSENVIVPIAGLVITYVLCVELISMVTEKNNMHDVDTFMFFKWFFKAWVAVYLVTHTFDITMAVFDVAQHVVSGAAGVISGSTEIDVAAALASMQEGSFGYKEVPEFLQEQTQQPEKANPLKHVEDTIEQNDNNFDGIINNTPTTDELEAKARSGEQISLAEYAAALKAEQEQGKEKKPGKKAEKKPSIRAQLKADKERAAQRKQARSKSQDLERS